MSKILSKKELYRVPFLQMMETSYQKKDGSEGKWYHVERTNNTSAVMIVPLVEDASLFFNSKLVLIKEYRVPLQDYEYGFPAGLIDEGETIEEAIVRELKEETGLDLVEIVKISPPLYNSAGLTNESITIAYVRASGQISTKHNEDSEDIEVLLKSNSEVKELFYSGVKFSAKAWLILFHMYKFK